MLFFSLVNMLSKDLIRVEFKKRRAQLAPSFCKQASDDIIRQIRLHPAYQKARHVGLYFPINNEVSLLSLLGDKKTFYFPKVKDNTLIFCPVNNIGELMPGYHNIMEPPGEKGGNNLELLLVPALCFNGQGHRIGYGKGFYDRFLATFNGYSIGVGYFLQQLNFTASTFDIPVKEVITNSQQKYNVVILAAGQSQRLGQDKIMFSYHGKYLFEHAQNVFDTQFNKYVILSENNYFLLNKRDDICYLIGEKRRDLSLLTVLPYLKPTVYTFIHDGARPYLEAVNITNLIKELAKESDAFSLYHTLADNISYQGKYLARNDLICYQTPQVIKTNLLKQLRPWAEARDDIMLLRHQFPKASITLVKTIGNNQKITYPDDLSFYKRYFSNIKRIGHSFDLHIIDEKRPLWLAGLKISERGGLAAVSDGDCILHAISEALLGAIGKGDLGTNFPPRDPKNKGLASKKILSFALEQLKSLKYSIINIDIIVYYELVMLAPFYEKMITNLAHLLAISPQQINFKATTSEKIGPIGKGQAMGAEVVVLLGAVSDY